MTTVAPNVDFSCVNEFFNADDVILHNNAMYNRLNIFGAAEDIVYSDIFGIIDKYEMMKLIFSELGFYSKEKVSKLFTTGLAAETQLYNGLSRGTIPEKAHPSGPCLPGVMRPFVDVHGNIFPCERISESSEAMKIGHIDTGFDMDKVYAVLNIGKLTETECKNCWNFIQCQLCAASCDKDGRLCEKERLKYCDSAKNNTINSMITVCLLLENGYKFPGREVFT